MTAVPLRERTSIFCSLDTLMTGLFLRIYACDIKPSMVQVKFLHFCACKMFFISFCDIIPSLSYDTTAADYHLSVCGIHFIAENLVSFLQQNLTLSSLLFDNLFDRILWPLHLLRFIDYVLDAVVVNQHLHRRGNKREREKEKEIIFLIVFKLYHHVRLICESNFL